MVCGLFISNLIGFLSQHSKTSRNNSSVHGFLSCNVMRFQVLYFNSVFQRAQPEIVTFLGYESDNALYSIPGKESTLRLCRSREYPYQTSPMDVFFVVVVLKPPLPHPSENSSLGSYFPLIILAFETPPPPPRNPFGIFSNHLWGGYGYFLEPHIIPRLPYTCKLIIRKLSIMLYPQNNLLFFLLLYC